LTQGAHAVAQGDLWLEVALAATASALAALLAAGWAATEEAPAHPGNTRVLVPQDRQQQYLYPAPEQNSARRVY